MKVAIVHFVLLYMSGGEKVLEALCELYPNADIFTHVYDPDKVSKIIKKHKIHTTSINDLPFSRKYYKYYLPFMPRALERLDLSNYDLIISCESGPTKGIIPDPDALHICYCHSPMRYIWDRSNDYLNKSNRLKGYLLDKLFHKLRIWDYTSTSRVDYFIANSKFVSRRIMKFYRRNSIVLPPPVDTDKFKVSESKGEYFLWLGRFVPYKRPDIALNAFNSIGKRLIMVGGSGEEKKAIKKKANKNIQILGYQNEKDLQKLLSECRALIFPGIEDAGIAPVEAMASGRPVIAYNKGGAQSTIIEGKTGVFFNEQSSDALIKAIERFEKIEHKFDKNVMLEHARKFDKNNFKEKFHKIINDFQNRTIAST